MRIDGAFAAMDEPVAGDGRTAIFSTCIICGDMSSASPMLHVGQGLACREPAESYSPCNGDFGQCWSCFSDAFRRMGAADDSELRSPLGSQLPCIDSSQEQTSSAVVL